MNRKETVLRRSRLLMFFLWVSTILAFTTLLSGGYTVQKALTMLSFVILLAMIVTWCVIKKKWVIETMYVVTVGMAVATFVLIWAKTSSISLMMVYIAMAVASIYQEKNPMRLMILFGIIVINYFIYTQPENLFMTVDISAKLNLNLVFILFATLAYMQVHFADLVRSEVYQVHKNTRVLNNKNQNLLDKVTETTHEIDSYSEVLQKDMKETVAISHELRSHFEQISLNIEDQAQRVEQMAKSMCENDEGISSLAQSSETMGRVTDETQEIALEGNNEIEGLSEIMLQMVQMNKETSQMMTQLKEETASIEEILDAINSIAEQTGLLSLNASIEAARAGEHGKGFAVVANEVRKLSDDSHGSVEKISEILHNIGSMTEKVNDQVLGNIEIVDHSVKSTERVVNVFGKITENTESMKDCSKEVEENVNILKDISKGICDFSDNLRDVSIENNHKIKGILEGINKEDQRIENTTKGFERLKGIVDELEVLVDENEG